MVLESSNDDTADLTLDVLLSVILPPAAVYRTRGISDSFWISMALSLLVVPGQVYALYVTAIEHDKEPGVPGIIEREPMVIEAPTPKRVVAVTPDYMNNASLTDINEILSGSSSRSYIQDKPKDFQSELEGQLPPPVAIGSSKRDRNIYI